MKNSFLLGLILGIISPALAYYLTEFTELQLQLFPTKPAGFYVLAATINLVSAWISHKKGFDKIATGLILATFLGMLWLIFTKNISI